ncbi:succinylglutamate desuccinylase/aspartoacylase family protein [Halogeometricum sp. S1BR25-6]|uniref:Succinylglutamate desuccinylase/aspartoacylase family protein n=1 Tax=Halogeometricum salsisoli TaxID=2950536 RepID=A0ABU2GIH0_9EURY|nr:succinylglutamate desuccinylase/aspartoacylase family protein [Halogeometricum sp. S1BR25-6]MDS0300079.1 succinylglutamate desuccinylase/aspartoacylase family protein [Halogeometricum sp. S1BR25-6]
MKVGTAESEPGEISRGHLSVAELPTGGDERLPVVVVEGEEPGPTAWATGAIHGDEPTGTAAIHEFLDRVRDRAKPLRGTLVCVPVTNPAGVRTNSRTSYYHGDDPNRLFGVGREGESEGGSGGGDGGTPPRVQQVICERLYEEIRADADVVVSLHTSWVATHPYTIRPRVGYGAHREEAAAASLRDRVVELADAFGLPVVNQFGRAETERRALAHTLTGAAVADGIPAFTPELGGRFVVERDAREAAVAGLFGVCSTLGMLDDVPEDRSPAFKLSAEGDLKRLVHPHADAAGLVRYRVREGEWVDSGDVVADVRTPHGERKSTVATERSGYVLSLHEGAAVYENDPLLDLAVPDGEPLLYERSG